MPLTAKGQKILASLEEQYGKEEAKRILYAGKNKGTFTGIDSEPDPLRENTNAGTISGVDAMAEKDKDEEYWEGKESAFERNAKTKAARRPPKDSATTRTTQTLRIDVMPSGRVKVTRR